MTQRDSFLSILQLIGFHLWAFLIWSMRGNLDLSISHSGEDIFGKAYYLTKAWSLTGKTLT